MKYLIIILLVFVFACSGDGDKRISRDEVYFTTTDASELFFKNVRQTSYDKQGLAGSDIQIFRISERSKTDDYPVLFPAIALNWMHDEAYIILETNSYLDEEDNLVVKWKDSDTGDTGEYVVSGGSKNEEYSSAVDIYTSLQDGHDLTIMVNGKAEPLLHKKEDREAFRKTMIDYLRLVNVLK